MYPGHDLLQQGSPFITFSDLTSLLEKLTEGDGYLVHVWTPFGTKLKDIANNEGLTHGQQLKQFLREFLNLLCTLCLGEQNTATLARFWALNECCPLLPDKQKVQGVSAPKKGYATAKVAIRKKVVAPGGAKEHETVKVALHRIVAWIARGEPPGGPGGKAQAIHRCAKKGCLSLQCIRWGTREHNAVDVYVQDCLRQNTPRPSDRAAPKPM
jgi:hypothetical protein